MKFLMIAALTLIPAEREPNRWRLEHRDDVVSLCLIAKINGVSCSYDGVKSLLGNQKSKVSMVEIAEAARSLGMQADIYKVSLPELSRLAPAVIYSEKSVAQGGGFQVLMEVEADRVLLLDGYTSRLMWLNEDRFRRMWTGHVLSVKRVWFTRSKAFLFAVVGLFAIASLYLVIQRRAMRHV